MKKVLIFIFLILIITITAFPSHAFWWMGYHKPAFKGNVIDAETKEPIEGAVVVVVYNKATIGLGAGALSSIINVREVLTDKEGMFRISSYTTIIQPFSVEDEANFIIFKPGYGSFLYWRVSPPKNLMMYNENWRFIDFEEFFSSEFGAVKEVWGKEAWVMGAVLQKIKVTFGLVELPKLKTREERLRNIPGGPTDMGAKKLPLFYKLINEERKNLGLEGEVWR